MPRPITEASALRRQAVDFDRWKTFLLQDEYNGIFQINELTRIRYHAAWAVTQAYLNIPLGLTSRNTLTPHELQLMPVILIQHRLDASDPTWKAQAFIAENGICGMRTTYPFDRRHSLLSTIKKFLDVEIVVSPSINRHRNMQYLYTTRLASNSQSTEEEERCSPADLWDFREMIVQNSWQYKWAVWHKDHRRILHGRRAANPEHNNYCPMCGNYDYEDTRQVCDVCTDRLRLSCYWCGHSLNIGNQANIGSGGRLIHSSCYDEMHNENEDEDEDDNDHPDIASWDFKPNFRHIKTLTDTAYDSVLTTGVELEVEFEGEDRSGAASEIALISKDFYLKHDGSLGHGFEIVSHPHTLKAFRESKLAKILEICRDYGGSAEGDVLSCGLHVHINREALDFEDLIKMGMFVNNLPKLWLPLSRRRSPNFSEYREKTPYNAAESQGRYEAINHENKATVEVRIWRGTTDFETAMGSIELTHALVRWIKAQNPNRFEHELPDLFVEYCEYVQSNPMFKSGKNQINNVVDVLNSNLKEYYSYNTKEIICA